MRTFIFILTAILGLTVACGGGYSLNHVQDVWELLFCLTLLATGLGTIVVAAEVSA